MNKKTSLLSVASLALVSSFFFSYNALAGTGNLKKMYINVGKDGVKATSQDVPSAYGIISNDIKGKVYASKGNHAIIYGGVQKTSQGIKFDGVNDYVALNMKFTGGTESLAQFSAGAWIKVESNKGGWSVLDFDRSEFFNFTIGGTNSGWADHVDFNTTDINGGLRDMQGTKNVADGQWHHVAVVYDGKDKYIYVDGTLDSKQTNPHGGKAIGKNGVTRYGFIGEGSESPTYNGPRNNAYFEGYIKDVSFWNRGLSPEEILSISKTDLKGNEAGLIDYWKLSYY